MTKLWKHVHAQSSRFEHPQGCNSWKLEQFRSIECFHLYVWEHCLVKHDYSSVDHFRSKTKISYLWENREFDALTAQNLSSAYQLHNLLLSSTSQMEQFTTWGLSQRGTKGSSLSALSHNFRPLQTDDHHGDSNSPKPYHCHCQCRCRCQDLQYHPWERTGGLRSTLVIGVVRFGCGWSIWMLPTVIAVIKADVTFTPVTAAVQTNEQHQT